MANTKSLFVLLVGINQYSDTRYNLDACVSDCQNVKKYLQTYFNHKNCIFKVKALYDQKATRANIIDGFSHFEQAVDGDTCLFYYAGHGSQCPAPEAFWHLEPDRLHETLVCHDSRSPNGRDLLDKELSYLIWRATKNKKIHFVLLMDCCHSGGITRKNHSKSRQIKQNSTTPFQLKDYLGVEYFEPSGQGQYTPPSSHHILLTASKAKETAKEIYVDGKAHGVFTYCLLEVLQGARHQITYAELVSRIRLRIKNKVSDQSPQLEVTRSNDEALFFLSGISGSTRPVYIVAYSQTKQEWLLDAGALHAIQPTAATSKTTLSLEGIEQREIQIKEVFPSYSTLKGMENFDQQKNYRARIKQVKSPVFPIAFDVKNDAIGENLLRKALADYKSSKFVLLDNPKESQYLIQAKQNHYFLTKPDEVLNDQKQDTPISIDQIRAVFKKIKGYTPLSTKQFIYSLEKVSNWIQLLEMTHPDTTIQAAEIQIQLFRSTQAGVEHNSVSVEELDWKNPGVFEYQKRENQWHRPAFKLKIKNTGRRTLWFSLLYLSENFGIDNLLIPKQELQAGEEVWASYQFDGRRQFVIPLQLEDHYLKWGIHRIEEYLKLMICTEEFGTSHFNQEGLNFDEQTIPVQQKGGGISDRIEKSDWTCREILVEIVRLE